MKYRFNWNAPIVASHHDPSVVYHASNVLLKTVNRGMSWTEVSGDLTRNDDEKQGPGGGPITNEGAGGEIYGTIFYVAESPHEASTIWTGSDDGQEIEDTISALQRIGCFQRHDPNRHPLRRLALNLRFLLFSQSLTGFRTGTS